MGEYSSLTNRVLYSETSRKILMRVVSWNVLRPNGASAADIARLVERENPDLLLLQEAMPHHDELQKLLGGYYIREAHPQSRFGHGLVAWSPVPLPIYRLVQLPGNNRPTKEPRIALVLDYHAFSVACLHLSHGQILVRQQFRTLSQAIDGPLAVLGDFNVIGPITLNAAWSDKGPWAFTHMAYRFGPLRLDRCLVREVKCIKAKALPWAESDHRPIIAELRCAPLTAVGNVSRIQIPLPSLPKAVAAYKTNQD
jgi:endonuclease/exonuclease/phosphatase (EEP) superfamily protein YafD